MKGGGVVVRPAVEALPSYRRLSEGRATVALDGNENPLGPSPLVAEAARLLDTSRLARYPETRPLVERWARRLGVRPDQVVLTSGSGPAIALAAELVLGPSDVCVMAAPSFELYGWAAARRDACVRAVPCSRENGFAFPSPGFRAALKDRSARPKLVILGYPDNPTGRAPSRAFLEREARRHSDVLFLVDEAYGEFYGDSVLPLAKRLSNVLIARTFSKALGLAGERIGGLIGNARLIEHLHRINVPYPVTVHAVAVGLAALEDEAHVRATVRQAKRSVGRLSKGIRALDVPCLKTRANFVLADLGSAERARTVCEALERRGVAIRDRSHLPGMAGFVRVSSGTDAEVERLLDEVRLLLAPLPEAILFDMDGVLVDVRRSYDEAVYRTVRSFLAKGTGVSRERVLAVKNRVDANDDIDASCIALRALGVRPPRSEVERRFTALYHGGNGRTALRAKERWLLPARSLKWLAARARLGIVTGRPRRDAELALDGAGVGNWFDAVVTADDVRQRKPDPAPIRAALRKLRVRSAWLAGDSAADLLAGRRAGITTIGICPADSPYGAVDGRIAALRRYAPLAVLSSVGEIPAALRQRVAVERASTPRENE